MPITLDVPMAEYLKMDALSSGVAWRAVNLSPMHAKYCVEVPRDSSSVSNKGEIAHRLLLERHEDNIVLVNADDWRTKAAKEERDAAYACGKIPILEREMASIRDMAYAGTCFINTTEAAGVFETGNPEVTVTWDDNGVPCKARPDYLTDRWHISVKTTGASADPGSWTRRMLTPMGYDFGLSFYRRGLEANGIDVEHRLLVIEQNPPHGCCLVALAPNKAAIADADVDRAINLWRECRRFNNYPGYDTRTHWAEATAYELEAAEDRELQMMAGAGK